MAMNKYLPLLIIFHWISWSLFYIVSHFSVTYPPKISGPIQLAVTYQQQYNFQVTATSNSSSNLTYSINTNGTSVTMDPATGSFTWFVNSSDFRLNFIVQDSNGVVNFAPSITLCYCLNNATCNISSVNQLANSTNNLLTYGECTCLPGYDGAFCQDSASLCEGSPCFDTVNCTDNFANMSADCGPCPTGYIGDGRKCFGMAPLFIYSC